MVYLDQTVHQIIQNNGSINREEKEVEKHPEQGNQADKNDCLYPGQTILWENILFPTEIKKLACLVCKPPGGSTLTKLFWKSEQEEQQFPELEEHSQKQP